MKFYHVHRNDTEADKLKNVPIARTIILFSILSYFLVPITLQILSSLINENNEAEQIISAILSGFILACLGVIFFVFYYFVPMVIIGWFISCYIFTKPKFNNLAIWLLASTFTGLLYGYLLLSAFWDHIEIAENPHIFFAFPLGGFYTGLFSYLKLRKYK